MVNCDEFYVCLIVFFLFWYIYLDMLVGKDLFGGGIWMGVMCNGYIVVFINICNLSVYSDSKKIWGELVVDYLID